MGGIFSSDPRRNPFAGANLARSAAAASFALAVLFRC
jgi:hypothetical protein